MDFLKFDGKSGLALAPGGEWRLWRAWELKGDLDWFLFFEDGIGKSFWGYLGRCVINWGNLEIWGLADWEVGRRDGLEFKFMDRVERGLQVVEDKVEKIMRFGFVNWEGFAWF